jgi:hypothetical protein
VARWSDKPLDSLIAFIKSQSRKKKEMCAIHPDTAIITFGSCMAEEHACPECKRELWASIRKANASNGHHRAERREPDWYRQIDKGSGKFLNRFQFLSR